MSSIQNNALISSKEAAALLGISPATLAVWRCVKRYPLPYIKVGRLVKYRREDLDRFLDSRRHGEARNDP